MICKYCEKRITWNTPDKYREKSLHKQCVNNYIFKRPKVKK